MGKVGNLTQAQRTQISERVRLAQSRPEVRAKMLASAKRRVGVPLSPEHRKKISDALLLHHPLRGTHCSEETKQKIREKNLGVLSGKYIHGRCKDPKFYNWLKNKRNRVKKRLNEAGSSHTFEDWEFIKESFGFCCAGCGSSETDVLLTEDHIIPLSKGGTDNKDNIQPLCQSCNSKKGTKIIKYEKQKKD